MPVQKDLKRLIRNRMQRTGESYTTARLHVLGRKPIPKNYLDLAGMGHDAVRAKTGRDWREWVRTLDADGAAGMLHRDIARHVADAYGASAWWAQTVTVAYERIRGLRDVGQRRSGKEPGTYDANKSKTFPVPVSTLYRAWSTRRSRDRWLGEVEMRIRTSSVDRSMRITWADGTSVNVWFTDKGPGKSQVAVQHGGLSGRSAVDRAKRLWTERLAALGEVL